MSNQPPPVPSAPLEQDALRARKFRTSRTITALMLREMSTTYGRSPGGYLWAVLDPVAGLFLLSAVFAVAFSAPPLGTSFPLFYATGYLPFMMFNDVANKMATSVNFSKPLLAYPAVTFLDALIARFLLNVLTHAMVAYIIFSTLVFVFGARAQIDLPAILLSTAMTAALGIGVGTLNCYLMTNFPIWERAWQIATRPLFIISGIFFVYGDLPPLGREILWYNPLTHVIGMMRVGFYATYQGDYISVLYVASISALTFCMGLLLLWRNHRRFMEG
ncbi:ABC transporter permease [Sulfitobacter sabulilitoris]|uniref:Transport permease protein n=1 Tax=Sulfitobacter sabulilitoris TaxID=2562655 RepID=A0A5S3P851_9RHOB|nr:ABC transporter permease [Sulfitobacter sabulilitoris]TMM49372.1 sugar ABC transporter permease [Sulfitobacter sabulilitoris]